MPSLSNAVTAPPHCVMARAPMFADATKQPSVVSNLAFANGTYHAVQDCSVDERACVHGSGAGE